VKETVSHDSAVGLATGHRLDGPGSNPGGWRDFPYPSRLALGPTQPPVQWVPGHFPGVKRPGRGVNHTPPCSKGKVVPLQALRSPEGSRKLRFPDYMTTAQDGVKAVSPAHRPPLPPGNAPGTHFC